MRYLHHPKNRRSVALRWILVVFLLTTANVISINGFYVYAAEGSFFSIHLLSYKEVDKAEAKVKELNDLGYNAFYRQETVNGKADIYNIYIEKFTSRSDAEREADILKELGLISDYDIQEIIEEKTERNLKNERPKLNNNKEDLKVYYLKVCSLKERDNAERYVKKLQDAGYHAFYNYESIEGKGEWYRVYIDEEYKSREDAIRDAKKMMESGIISAYEIKRATSVLQQSESGQNGEKKIYSLHIGSFKDGVNAEQEVHRLTESDFKVFTVKMEISGEKWVRVYLGEFQEEKAAREAGAELLQKGVISYFKPMLINKTGE